MSQEQAAANATATRNLAERLTRQGFVGDAMAEAEAIVTELLRDGLAPIRRPEPVPLRGRGGSDEARVAAMEATAKAVAEARARREQEERARTRAAVSAPITSYALTPTGGPDEPAH